VRWLDLLLLRTSSLDEAAKRQALEDQYRKESVERDHKMLWWTKLMGVVGVVGLLVAAFGVTVNVLEGNTNDAPGAERSANGDSPPGRNAVANATASETQGVSINVELVEPSAAPWILPSNSAPSVSPPETCGDKAGFQWMHNHGGIQRSSNVVDVAMVSNVEATVVVKAFRLTYLKRDAPVRGTEVRLCEGAGPLGEELFRLSLDGKSPLISHEAARIPEELSYFELAAHRAKIFRIYAFTSKYFCRWSAEMEILQGGTKRTVEINNQGKPFEVTA
jgi:hypothetical protein